MGIQSIYFQNYIPQRSKTHDGEPAGDLAEGEKGPVGEIAAESYEDELNKFFLQVFRSLFGMVDDESVCAEF